MLVAWRAPHRTGAATRACPYGRMVIQQWSKYTSLPPRRGKVRMGVYAGAPQCSVGRCPLCPSDISPVNGGNPRSTPNPQRRGTPLWLPRCGAGYAKRINPPYIERHAGGMRVTAAESIDHSHPNHPPSRGKGLFVAMKSIARVSACWTLGVPRTAPGQPQGRAPTGALFGRRGVVSPPSWPSPLRGRDCWHVPTMLRRGVNRGIGLSLVGNFRYHRLSCLMNP